MTSNYIGINGLVTQSLEEIRQDLITKFQSIYGSDINLEQNSPDGQWINILAQEKKDILDLFTQFYNNLDPDTVIGLPQQVLYKLNGLTIKAYGYSYCYVNITVTQSVTLQGLDDNIDNADGTGYTVRDTNGNRWILATTQNLTEGVHLLNFRAADLGSITALANTINVMETIIGGVSAVNNPANNYITGNTGESASQFRTRRSRSMAVPSQGFDESVESQLLSLDNVTQAKVYDNRTNQTVNDIPPHTLWVIVEGGAPEDIGRVIYNNLPPGIPSKGEQVVPITKVNGDVVNVFYDLPVPIPLFVRATIMQLTSLAVDLDYVKTQLAQTTFEIRETVETADITTELKDILGNTGSPYNVEISQDNVTWYEVLTPAGLDEFFTLSTDNISLTMGNA